MAEEAGSVAVRLLANTDDFKVKTKIAANSFGQSMKQIEATAGSAERAVGRSMATTERSFARAAQQSRNLGYQISDIGTQLASGSSPFLILAQQGPQVANALDGARGAVGRFATFLSGPWGAALLAGTTLLGAFIFKKKESAETSDKAARAERSLADVLDDTTSSYEEVTKALDDYNRAKEKEREVTIQALAQQARSIAANLQEAISVRERTKARLDEIEAMRRDPRILVDDTMAAGLAAGASDLARELAKQNDAIENLRQGARNALVDIASAVADLRTDPEQQIKTGFEILRNQAKKTITDVTALTAALEGLNKKEADALETLRKSGQERRKQATERRQSLPNVTGAEIARALGTTINSGYRTAAQNKRVGGDANSYHLGGPNADVQAIDIPLQVNGQPLTKAGIRAALAPLGVQLKELLGPGDKGHNDHFHLAFARKRLGPDEVAAAEEKARKEIADALQAEADRLRDVAGEMAGLDSEILQRRRDAAVSAADRAGFEVQQIDAAEKAYAAQVDYLVEQKKVTEAEATILKAKNKEIADLDRAAVERQEAARKRREALDVATGLLDNNLDLLKSEESLATSQKERRQLALAILDVEYQRLRTALEAQIKEAEINGLSDEQIAVMRQRLANLTTLQANATQGALRDTAGPFEDYITGIRDTATALDEELEGVAVGGLQSIVDGLGDAAAGFTSLGDVARGVLGQLTAQLVRLAAQQLILKAIGETVGKSAEATASGAESAGQAAASGASAATAATTAQAALVAAAWAPAAAAASLATLGANQGPALTALLTTHALSAALSATGGLARKDGGPIFGPGGPRSDSVPVLASNGEYMIRAKAASKLGLANLDYINRTGEIPAFAEGGSISASRIRNGHASPQGSAGGFAPADLAELKSVLREAVDAMPAVNLFPTLSPEKALEAALSRPGGRRAMLDFMGENAGKVRGTIDR